MGEFRNFKEFKKLPALIVKVGDAEEEMDSLFFTAMHGLYKESREDALDIFIWDKLFQRMEEHGGYVRACIRHYGLHYHEVRVAVFRHRTWHVWTVALQGAAVFCLTGLFRIEGSAS